MLYLVRHAKAGSRSRWDEDDRLRPLTPAGHRQAVAIAERLAEHTTGGRLLSSPFQRCVETLQPLAKATGIAIETDERLSEGAIVGPVLELLATLPEGSVLCSHGDVIPDTMQALQRRGTEFRGEPDWRKGSVWVLRREDGVITRAKAWAPPDE